MRVCKLVFLSVLVGSLVACGGGHATQSQPSTSTVTLTSISVTASRTSLPMGLSQQVTATGNYSDGTSKPLSVTWSSSAASVLSVDSTGMAKALTQGTATVTASSGAVSGSLPMSVTAAEMVKLEVSPVSFNIFCGGTQQLAAKGTYTDGSTKTESAQWSSSNSTVASVDSTGLVTAHAPGSVTITAASGALTGSSALSARMPVLTTIIVAPSAPQVPAGISQQFTATGVWEDNSSRELTAEVAWSSSDSSKASISSSGMATGVAATSSPITIAAAKDGVTGTTSFSVTAAQLTAVDVGPDAAVVPKGANQQFTAIGTYTDSSTQDISGAVNWSSDASSVATVNASGLAFSLGTGTANIQADAGVSGVSADTGVLTVTDAQLVSIQVLPENATISTLGKQQMSAIGTYTDGSTLDISASVTWASSHPEFASIDAAGMVVPVTAGTTAISAALNGITGQTNLNITGARLMEIAVTPAVPQVGIGATVQFTATALFDDGTVQDISNVVTWSSSNASVAVVASSGLASTVGMGQARITASINSISGSTTLTVTSARLQGILILPADFDLNSLTQPPVQPTLTMLRRAKMQLKAVGYYTDQSFRTLLGVGWSSSKPNTAIVNGSGTLRSKGRSGNVTVSASWNGSRGTATVSIGSQTISAIVLSPAPASAAVGTGMQFSALATLSDGTQRDVTATVRWTSDDYHVATINNSGYARTWIVGTTRIIATYYNTNGTRVTGTTDFTSTDSRLTGITVTPATAIIPLGASASFTAMASFDNAPAQDVTPIAVWGSSDIAVLVSSFTTRGLAITAGSGTASFTASMGAVSGTASVTVTPPAP